VVFRYGITYEPSHARTLPGFGPYPWPCAGASIEKGHAFSQPKPLMTSTATVLSPPRSTVSALARDMVSLAKPGITIMCVLMTAGGAGFALHTAPGAAMSAAAWLALIIGTGLSVASANAMNMVMERDGDRLMRRTKDRPLPSGRMRPWVAVVFATLTAAVSWVWLWTAVNALTACLAIFALVSYVWIYTPLKRRTPQALVIGAVPGAIPPLMGWAGAAGSIAAPGVILFLILLLWQLPHFIAIALYRNRDYADAGIKTVPVVRGEEVAKIQSLIYSLVLFPVSLTLVLVGAAGYLYFVVAACLGIWFFIFSVRGFEPDAGNQWARRFFFASLVYLPVLTAGLVLDVVLGL